ncbi:MAG: isocitrate/isopropylmalate family dehydrogenase [Bacteroidota bacterium]|nr:isocitrate/isopropylmalate family dehydrogenase [Bacteroidota bacterium]
MSAVRRVTLIRGDGIGPEITEAVVRIFEAARVPIEWEEAYAGLACYQEHGTPLPQATIDSILRNGVALKGPTTTPVGEGFKSVNVTIRKALDLFANVRPAKSLPGIVTRYGNVDLIVVRENIEDTYGGIEHVQTPDVVQTLRIITRQGSALVHRYAFEMARRLGRRRVTCVHKANIHKYADGLFLETFREVSRDYPEIVADDIIVDNACMQLVVRPETFDVLVLPNLFGDIVSDLCAGLVGGLGVAPGGNIGRYHAVFEAVHGSAPDIAGKGVANPTALLLSALQMLDHMGLSSYARCIEQALHATLKAGVLTRDLGGSATTRAFTDAIIARLDTSHCADSSDGSSRASVILVEPPPPQPSQQWQCIGADVFVEWNDTTTVPAMPEQVGPLTLTMISNRGTKIYPPPIPPITMVNWYRCRYLASGPIENSAVVALLEELIRRSIRWMHVELLAECNGTPMFSKAQGE